MTITDMTCSQAGCDDQPISDNGAEAVHAIKWQTSSRYMMVEAFSQIDAAQIDPLLSITTQAA